MENRDFNFLLGYFDKNKLSISNIINLIMKKNFQNFFFIII